MENYNEYVVNRLRKLIESGKEEVLIDLHIHTNYSSDGKQGVLEVINKYKEMGFDIISIADHDSIAAYDEIMNNTALFSEEYPIVVPGVEFTVLNDYYRGYCHILKYFFCLNDDRFKQCLSQNISSYWKRIQIQFEQIQFNQVIQYYLKKYHFSLTPEEYKLYCERQDLLPDYASLMEYIHFKFKREGIKVEEVYHKIVDYYERDECTQRKDAALSELVRFWNRNDGCIADKSNKLAQVLAIRDVYDSEFPNYPSMGNLSIYEYGQINLNDLKNTGINIMAHPNSSQLDTVKYYKHILHGLEMNYRSSQEENQQVCNLSADWLITKGSDSHLLTDNSGYDTNFYKVKIELVEKLLETYLKTVEQEETC